MLAGAHVRWRTTCGKRTVGLAAGRGRGQDASAPRGPAPTLLMTDFPTAAER